MERHVVQSSEKRENRRKIGRIDVKKEIDFLEKRAYNVYINNSGENF